mgnify:CR=1 FL=1
MNTTPAAPPCWPTDSDWTPVLKSQFTLPYFVQLQSFVKRERLSHTVYPEPANVYAAFASTSLASTRVVLLGQDPYHGPGQAQGLSFSVPAGAPIPPSLRNMFKELSADEPVDSPPSGSLQSWADQGVLLLNTVLTVRDGEAHSHRGQGWEAFTDHVIDTIGRQESPVVFLLWGAAARKKKLRIGDHHAIIESAHPSPLSAYRGFFGSRPFSRCNDALLSFGKSPIRWA